MAYNLIKAIEQGTAEKQSAARDAIDSPRAIFTHPTHGTFHIVIHDGSDLYLEPAAEGATVEHNYQDRRRDLIVRGVSYYSSARLTWNDEPGTCRTYGKGSRTPDDYQEQRIDRGFRVAPGDYQRGEERVTNWGHRPGLYATRSGSFSQTDTSDPAKRALVTIFEDVANAWNNTVEAERLRAMAVIVDLNNKIASAEQDAEKAEATAATERGKVAHLEEQIEEARSALEYIERRTAANAATRAGR